VDPFVDTGLTNGATYYYRITAVDYGGEGAPSAPVAVTPALPPPPPASSLTSAQAISVRRRVLRPCRRDGGRNHRDVRLASEEHHADDPAALCRQHVDGPLASGQDVEVGDADSVVVHYYDFSLSGSAAASQPAGRRSRRPAPS